MNTRFGSVTLLLGLILATIWTVSISGSAVSAPILVQATSVGSGFTYQGKLDNAKGPVNAICTFRFALYNAASDGAQVGETLSRSTQVDDGLFTVELDFGAETFVGEKDWLQIAVQCPGDTGFTLLTPRQQLTAVPYALSLVPGAKISGAADVGLTIENTADTASQAGIAGDSTTTGLWAKSAGVGVQGESSAGTGVLGRSSNAAGVQGESSAGTGVLGRSSNAAGVYGSSDSGWGVVGRSPNNVGVEGQSTTGWGVVGRSSNAAGVYGSSDSGWGVVGDSDTSVGVYGRSSRWAGWFEGNTYVNGNLSKAAGSFIIDHPLDPANKYLSHSFVESPDMKNIYDGMATTDANGEAVVELPSYFAALNRDFRYQLTVIGEFAQAIVASEVANNHFTIRTDKPNVKVSWQVTGIRQDAYANAHRIIVEQDKPLDARGTFLHPAEQGQPASKGLGYELWQAMRRSLQPAAPEPTRPIMTQGR